MSSTRALRALLFIASWGLALLFYCLCQFPCRDPCGPDERTLNCRRTFNSNCHFNSRCTLKGNVASLTWAPDGMMIAFGDAFGKVQFWQLA